MKTAKRIRAKPAWAILYRGQIGTYICTDRQEIEGACGKGEKVVRVNVSPVGKPYEPREKDRS